MSGAWYALATLAVAWVVWQYIRNDRAAPRDGSNSEPKQRRPWRSGRPD